MSGRWEWRVELETRSARGALAGSAAATNALAWSTVT